MTRIEIIERVFIQGIDTDKREISVIEEDNEGDLTKYLLDDDFDIDESELEGYVGEIVNLKLRDNKEVINIIMP
jgi:predicted nuclease of restriction endonuclease-like RecB superfamily